MRYAIIEDGVVVNAAEAEAPLADNWILAATAEIGDLYADGVFTKPPPPPVDPDALAAAARAQRDSLLKQSDWTQLSDAPVDQAAWAAYRQALREVPDQPAFPLTIEWPTAPQ